jgi:hypothetical protein
MRPPRPLMSFFNWYIIVRFNIPCSICYLNLFTYIGVQHDFHIRWYSCRVTLIQRVPLVRQELLILPEHPSPHRVFFLYCFFLFDLQLLQTFLTLSLMATIDNNKRMSSLWFARWILEHNMDIIHKILQNSY